MPVVWPDGSVTGSLLVGKPQAAAPPAPEPELKEPDVVLKKEVVKDDAR